MLCHLVHITQELVQLLLVGVHVSDLFEERGDKFRHLRQFLLLLRPDCSQLIDLYFELFAGLVLQVSNLFEFFDLLFVVLGEARNRRDVLLHEHV